MIMKGTMYDERNGRGEEAAESAVRREQKDHGRLYECSNFVRENPDVVAVSIAYRISVFGFFHLSHLPDGKEYPDAQNLGLMDQMMALRWIHENIAGFGGDPDNVTVFGQSAGAAKEIDILQGCNKDEVNYFVFFKGVESYNAWGAAQKAKKLAQMTAEERTRTESFCADIRGESYESTSRLFDQIWFIAPLFRMIRKRSPKERSLTGTGPIH